LVNYRYGFNGQEKTDEIAGLGNHTTAKFWEYDTRIGRRWNLDPVRKEYESPYVTFGNNPLRYIDPSGKDTALYKLNAGTLVATKQGGDPKRTPIWVVDETAKNYNEKNPWATAMPLTYQVGKKAGGITGKSFRDDHPLKNIGTKYGAQVYKEDLLDLTDEFNYLIRKGLPEFDAIKNMSDNNGGFGRSPKQRAFQKLVTDDAKWDLKSRITADGTPSYAAVVIGEWSIENGNLRRYDDYGNIAYGIFGKAAKFSDDELYRGSELNQKWKDFWGKTNGNRDELRDVLMILTGIENYKYFQK
jgi:RHS repeat-associated protein